MIPTLSIGSNINYKEQQPGYGYLWLWLFLHT